MELSEKIIQNVGVLTVSGQIDASSAPEMEKALHSLVEAQHGKVVVDLAKVDYVSSAGLRVLLAGIKQARGLGGDLRVAGLQPQVKEVFDIAGFTPLFKIHADATAAVNSF
jgi:anti-sigma B factor antagonist